MSQRIKAFGAFTPWDVLGVLCASAQNLEKLAVQGDTSPEAAHLIRTCALSIKGDALAWAQRYDALEIFIQMFGAIPCR